MWAGVNREPRQHHSLTLYCTIMWKNIIFSI